LITPVAVEAPVVPVERGFRWGTLFWGGVGGLVLLGAGLGVVHLIEDLFARSESLGILGLGNIGKEVARIGVAFGMRVIAWSQNLNEEKAGAAGAVFVDKETLFREADVITIHLVLSRRTRGLIGAVELALMKPNARLVNTSRGPIVDEAALIEALRTRRIAGAAIDVFDAEPLSADHPFRKLENVLATPHIGYVTEDLYRTFYGDAAASIARWLEQNAPNSGDV